MRTALRLALLAAFLPILWVGSAFLHFPAVIWHRTRPPGETALMEIRARESRARGAEWDPRYEWVPLSRISPHLQRAVVAAEDTRFHDHWGFDLEQIREAWEANRRGEELRGASTITQQTVKNLYLSPSRNVLRKAREVPLALWMELWLPKDRILELYLNVVELGPGVFGAEAAARTYFGRSAAALTREQAALLAATLPAPLIRNPGAPSPRLWRRQRRILSRMERWYGDQPRLVRKARAPAEPGPVTVPAEPIDLPDPDPDALEAAPADSAPPAGDGA